MYNRVIKRIFDLIAGIVALPFLGLACLIIIPLIKAHDKGPVFYNAPRVGRHGRVFTMYKFRTMQVDAPDLKMPDGSTYNAPDDPRMTPVGKRLRGWSLDELPQVLNIIKGQMSFIGPRPDLIEEAALYQGDEKRKLEVRPGISGYAQVYGRNAIGWHDRLALDVIYVQKVSLPLDLHIFWRTFAVIFSKEGVYVEDMGNGFEVTGDGEVPSSNLFGPIPAPEFVSLVVVARDEEHYLQQILSDISNQDYPHDAMELLLVDSNVGDNTRQRRLMEGFAQAGHGFRRVVILDNPAGFLPHGCNVALAAYEGDIFMRLDAHARIPIDFVRQTVAVQQEGHKVCGGFRPVILEDPTAWGEVLLMAETSAFGASPARYRRAQMGREVSSVFHGAYSREVLDEVGLYDERLLRTEDNDLSQRIRAAGYGIWMDPRIQSQQYLRPNLRALLRQKAANGYWIGRTVWLKHRAVSLMHLVPFAFVLALIICAVLGAVVSWLPLLTICYLYAVANVALSILAALQIRKDHLQLLALPLVFLAMHVCYGVGTLVGLVRGLPPLSKRDR